MQRPIAFILLTVPTVALSKTNSSGRSSPEATVAGIIGVILIIIMIAVRYSRSKTTITRPDETTTEVSSSASTPSTASSSSTNSEPEQPKKRLVGPTTMTFPTVSQRSATVQRLKEKYGAAVRIIHRGNQQKHDAWVGRTTVYTLVMEVPVKCPECGETYAVDDFGLTDCPSCGKELAVYFDERVRKRMVGFFRDGKIYAPEKKKTSRARKAAPKAEPEALPEEPAIRPVEDRFSKIK